MRQLKMAVMGGLSVCLWLMANNAVAEQVPQSHSALEAIAANDLIRALPKKSPRTALHLEIVGLFGFAANDPYYYHFTAGGQFLWYLQDAIAVGAGAQYLFDHTRTDRIDDIRLNLGEKLPTWVFPYALAHLDIYLFPLYGKISLFNRWISYVRTYLVVGPGMRFASSDNDDAYLTHLGSPMVAHVGIGQHYYLHPRLTFHIELRDFLYLEKFDDTTISDQGLGSGLQTSLQSYLMLRLGWGWLI